MIYKSYKQVAEDVAQWSSELPYFAGVCGLPRAGSLIAYLLSAHRNCQLISWTDLCIGNETWKKPKRRNCPGADGRILVVDDTVATGGHMRKAKTQFIKSPYKLDFGAYFAMTNGKKEVDYYFQDVGFEDHLFEFNVMHHEYTLDMVSDLDGVICSDWNYDHEEDDLAEAYKNHLENAKCLIRPTFKLKAIVTGRLEKHRAATTDWLLRHNIQYDKLLMNPANSPHHRRDVGIWKGNVFLMIGGRMFIESDPLQAKQIAEISRRDCLDWKNQTLNKS